jgi:hypothetical protein
VAECLGEKYELMKDNPTQDYCLNELANHLITEAPKALFPADVLKYGANEALIDGVLNVFLTNAKGEKTGAKFSGHI